MAICGGGRVGLRRRFKAPISSEARVRIPSSAKKFFFCLLAVSRCRSSGEQALWDPLFPFFRRALPSWGRLVSGGGFRRYSPRFLPFNAFAVHACKHFLFFDFCTCLGCGSPAAAGATNFVHKCNYFCTPLGTPDDAAVYCSFSETNSAVANVCRQRARIPAC